MLLLAASLPASAFAAEKNLSLDYCERESTLPYTLGDLAAARFAVYGLLGDEYRTPQKIPQNPSPGWTRCFCFGPRSAVPTMTF